MGLMGGNKNKMSPQEIFTYRVIRNIYPEASIEREAMEVRGNSGKIAVLDFLVQFPSAATIVFLEVTELSICSNIPNNKGKQMEVIHDFIQRNSEYSALFLFGECFTTPANVKNSLSVMRDLALGYIPVSEAQEIVDDIAYENMDYLRSQAAINWNMLLKTLVPGLAKLH